RRVPLAGLQRRGPVREEVGALRGAGTGLGFGLAVEQVKLLEATTEVLSCLEERRPLECARPGGVPVLCGLGRLLREREMMCDYLGLAFDDGGEAADEALGDPPVQGDPLPAQLPLL